MPYILLLPVLLLIVFIFIAGIIFGALQSLGYFPAIGLKTFTLKYYKYIFKDPNFFSSLKFSLYTSFVSSFLAVVVGVLLAYFLLANSKKDLGFYNVYKIPIIVPHTVAALLVFVLFSQSGWIARILYRLGFIHNMTEFYPLVFDSKGIGVILAYIWKGAPFITLITYDILKKINDSYSKVALNLGANSFQVFWYVLLPLALPTILSGFIIIFAFSFGAFEIPYLLGPSNPKALPVLAYIYYKSIDLFERPYGMVINMCITFYSLIMVVLYVLVFQLIKKYKI